MCSLSVVTLLALSASATYSPPMLVPVKRLPTEVAASFGRTWDTVINAFAGRNIPIQTIERASGFIAAEPLPAPDADKSMADCGVYGGRVLIPGHAYCNNVRVLGESSRSTVRVTMRWTNDGPHGDGSFHLPCVSRGTWESAFEEAIEGSAELATKTARL